MAAKIIIDRRVRKGKVPDFSKLIEKLRGKAIFAKGYISRDPTGIQRPFQSNCSLHMAQCRWMKKLGKESGEGGDPR